MSNNDNSLIERLTTIIGRPPVSMNIPGNQLNRLRKDKLQYDAYMVDLNQYLKELEDSVKYVDPAIEHTFRKLKEDLVKIVYSLIKNLTEAEKIVDSVITKPELVKDTDIRPIIAALLSKVTQYFNYEEKYAYINEQINKIAHSKQYLNYINKQRKYERGLENELPNFGDRLPEGDNDDNNNNSGNNSGNNGVFLPQNIKVGKPKRQSNTSSGSIPPILRIPHDPNEIVLELSTPPSQLGGNTNANNDNNNGYSMESAPNSYNPSKRVSSVIVPIIPSNNRRNLAPTFVPNVVKQLKSYLIKESRDKNTNKNILASFDLINSPVQLLAHLKLYQNKFQKQYEQLNGRLRQNHIKILDILNKSIPKLKKLYYIKENIGLKIDEVKEYIDTLGIPFTSKNLYVNKNKPKVSPSIKLPSNYNIALKTRGYKTTATRRNQNRNTRPWWRRVFTRRQPPAPPQVVESEPITTPVEPPLRHNGSPWPPGMRGPLWGIPEKKARFANTEGEPLSTTLTYKESNEPIKLLAPNISSAESVITEPAGVAINWVAQPQPTSFWGRLFRRGPTTVRTTIGAPAPPNTRKWYQKLNPFSRRSSGGKRKTRKVRK